MKDFTEKIIIRKGDITELNVDAIVNPANTELFLGSGVAGAIRQKGGESIQYECNEIGQIGLGKVAITKPGRLQAKYIFHAAVMHLGTSVDSYNIKKSTENCFKRAEELKLKSIAFPALGTGIGGFPLEECAKIILDVAIKHLSGNSDIEKIYFILFDDNSPEVFKRVFNNKF